MSWRGRLALIRWNYHAIFSTIFSSKEYITSYIECESKFKVIKRLLFNLGAILKELFMIGGNHILVTDYIYMHLPSFFKTLKHYRISNLDFKYVYPMNMKEKNLSFVFINNFPSIKRMTKRAQEDNVLSSNPKKGSLLHIITNVKPEPVAFNRFSKKQNYKKIKEHFEKGSKIINCYPSKLFIELTRNCNCSCIMCGREKPSYDENLNMDLKLFKKIADYFFPYADYVDLRGFGETTLIKNINEYVDYALKYDCDFGIVTNMTVRNDKLWEKMVLNNFWLGVSFDGAKKQTYEKIRIHGKYDNVIHNFKLINRIAKKHNIKHRAYLVITVQKDNIDELDEIIKLGYKYGIRKIELSPVISPHDNDPYSLDLVQDKIKPNIQRAIQLCDTLGIEVSLIGTFGLEKKEKEKGHKLMARCPRPWSWLYINYNGKIGPCNHLMDPLFVLGDLNKKNTSFEKELNNERNQLMRAIIHTPFRYKSCEWCFKNRYDY